MEGTSWSTRIVGIVAAVAAFYVVRSCTTASRKSHAQDTAVRAIEHGTVFRDAGIDQLSPYEFFRRSHAGGGKVFEQTFVQGAEISLRKEIPGGDVRIEGTPSIQDLHGAMRAVLHYSGSMPIEEVGTRAMTGEIRQYYHSTGTVMLAAMCFPDLSACDDVPLLSEQAESLLLPRLSVSGIAGILPPHGNCSVERPNNLVTGGSSDIATCWYSPATLLMLSRMNVEETRELLRAIADDPEIKDLMKKAVEATH